MRYYEIEFYGSEHKQDWAFYIFSPEKLNNDKVKEKLQKEFLGVDGLEQHHLDNMVSVNEITAEEFTSFTGKEAVNIIHYYEIGFYGYKHEKDWTYYLKALKNLNDEEVVNKLQSEFLGKDGLEQHHLENVVSINEITPEDFTLSTGIDC